MSNFWNKSDGSSAAENAQTEYSIGGGDPIPDGSTVLAAPDDVGWGQDDSFNRFIEIRWNVMKPEALAGRKVFQKLWVTDADPRAKDAAAADKKRDKALSMLATIDANAGGKIGKLKEAPTDDQLAMALMNKPMALKVMVWEMNGSSGNWVAGVFPKTAELKIGTPKGGGGSAPKSGGSAATDLDDDIPF